MKWYNNEGVISTIITFIVGFLIVLLLGGCKSKEYITVPEYHTEYVCRTDTFHKMDSVYLKDSVYVYQKGDTVYCNKVAYRDRLHNIYKVKLDTIIKKDSVSVSYPVERQGTKNEQSLMALGRLFLAFLFLVVVAMVSGIWWYHNKKC